MGAPGSRKPISRTISVMRCVSNPSSRACVAASSGGPANSSRGAIASAPVCASNSRKRDNRRITSLRFADRSAINKARARRTCRSSAGKQLPLRPVRLRVRLPASHSARVSSSQRLYRCRRQSSYDGAPQVPGGSQLWLIPSFADC